MNTNNKLGYREGVVSVVLNLLLFVLKYYAGIVSASVALIADAWHTLSDSLTSLVVIFGIRMSSRKPDKEHPFGHGRIEYIAALIVSFLVIEVGFTFFKSSISKIMHPEEITFDPVPFIILILSILVKLWMAFFNNKLGKRIDSKVMLATAADSLGDVITTSATVISIVICHFTSINVDAIAGLIVSGIVIWSGVSIAKDTLEPLIGQRVPSELYQKITDMVESYEGIVGAHDLIVHNYGPNRSMATIHAEVPNDVSIEASHEIIDRIERDAKKELNILLVIHMDPVEMRDEEVLELRDKTSHIVHALDPELHFHDFRVLKENEQKNLIFDLVVPDSYTEKDANRVMHQLIALLHEMEKNVDCIITLDRSFEAPKNNIT